MQGSQQQSREPGDTGLDSQGEYSAPSRKAPRTGWILVPHQASCFGPAQRSPHPHLEKTHHPPAATRTQEGDFCLGTRTL